MATQEVALNKIKIDIGVQIRVKLDYRVIEKYADNMVAGDKFPPIVLFFDGTDYWLADGFHRIEAIKAKYLHVFADVRQGSRDDAIRHAITANLAHGLPLTSEDKRRAIRMAIAAWPKDTDRKIADRLRVDSKTVAKIRKTGSGAEIPHLKPDEKRLGRDGKHYPATQAKAAAPEPQAEYPPGDEMPPSLDEPPPVVEYPTDKIGNPIFNEEVAAVFARDGELDELARLVNKVKAAVLKGYESHDPLYIKFHSSGFHLECDAVHSRIKFARPYAVCPYCMGAGKDGKALCTGCKGHGWNTKTEYENVPREDRVKIKTA